MTKIGDIADKVLGAGLDDWVMFDTLLYYAREAAVDSPGAYKQTAIDTLEYLLKNHLVAVGDIGDTGFEPWPGSDQDVVRRVIEKAESLDWSPQGDLCWMSNTSAGDQRASGV